jgi:hypothetical protein
VGTLLYWVGVNLDNEERRQAEFYLEEGQRLAHIGSWAFNPNGFEYWSSGLFRINGLDPKDNVPTKEEYLALDPLVVKYIGIDPSKVAV